MSYMFALFFACCFSGGLLASEGKASADASESGSASSSLLFRSEEFYAVLIAKDLIGIWGLIGLSRDAVVEAGLSSEAIQESAGPSDPLLASYPLLGEIKNGTFSWKALLGIWEEEIIKGLSVVGVKQLKEQLTFRRALVLCIGSHELETPFLLGFSTAISTRSDIAAVYLNFFLDGVSEAEARDYVAHCFHENESAQALNRLLKLATEKISRVLYRLGQIYDTDSKATCECFEWFYHWWNEGYVEFFKIAAKEGDLLDEEFASLIAILLEVSPKNVSRYSDADDLYCPSDPEDVEGYKRVSQCLQEILADAQSRSAVIYKDGFYYAQLPLDPSKLFGSGAHQDDASSSGAGSAAAGGADSSEERAQKRAKPN